MFAVHVSLPADFGVSMRNLTQTLHCEMRNHYSQSPHTVVEAPAISSLPRSVAESLLQQMAESAHPPSTSIGTGMVLNFLLESVSESDSGDYILYHRQVHANRSYPFVPQTAPRAPYGSKRPAAEGDPGPSSKRQCGPTRWRLR